MKIALEVAGSGERVIGSTSRVHLRFLFFLRVELLDLDNNLKLIFVYYDDKISQ